MNTEAETSRLAPFPRSSEEETIAFFSPKLPISVLARIRGMSTGDLVTTLMFASIPLLPYNAEFGPRMTSILSTRSISSSKSCPNALFELPMFSVSGWPLIITRKRVFQSPGIASPRTPE